MLKTIVTCPSLQLIGLCLWVLLLIDLTAYSQPTMGLLRNESGSFNGYTLFGNNETTYLIDNCGYIINQWQSAYKTGHGMYLLDNGDLLRAGSLPGTFEAGGRGGIFELFDWNGQVKWQYRIAEDQLHAHHDLAILPNGHFLAILWERQSEAEARSQGRIHEGEVWSERIVEIKMVGTDQADIVWQWRVWDHLIQDADPAKPNYGVIAEHPEKININYPDENWRESGNWLHFNAIDYHPGLDQIVVSSRLWSEIWVIDHSTDTEEAAGGSGGQYRKSGDLLYRYGNPLAYGRGVAADQQLNGQHDIKWIPAGLPYSGQFIVFNNQYIPGEASRVEIFSPPLLEDGTYHSDAAAPFGPQAPHWTYSENGLFSDILSGAQMLPNGNILICEGRQGYFFEISPQQEIVWEYINPVNRNGGPGIQGGEPRFNMTFRATRYAPDHPAFAGKDLSPGNPVELSPLPYDCDLFFTSPATDPNQPGVSDQLKILHNPFRQTLVVESAFESDILIRVFTLSGQALLTRSIPKGITQLDLSDRPSGLYLLQAIVQGQIFNRLIVKQ